MVFVANTENMFSASSMGLVNFWSKLLLNMGLLFVFYNLIILANVI